DAGRKEIRIHGATAACEGNGKTRVRVWQPARRGARVQAPMRLPMPDRKSRQNPFRLWRTPILPPEVAPTNKKVWCPRVELRRMCRSYGRLFGAGAIATSPHQDAQPSPRLGRLRVGDRSN